MIVEFQGEHRWLSNFWPAPVLMDGTSYPSVEHAYQAAKTLDFAERRRIRECATPGEAKRAGRRVTVRSDWERAKVPIMRDLLRAKFVHSDLRRCLLATGTEQLVEGNRWGDTFWGVCRDVGQNWLGRLLMEIREELR